MVEGGTSVTIVTAFTFKSRAPVSANAGSGMIFWSYMNSFSPNLNNFSRSAIAPVLEYLSPSLIPRLFKYIARSG